MWKTIGASMSTYRSYPRIVGETGGKDFIVAHRVGRRRRAGRRDGARRLRVPGPEVLGGEPRLRAEVDLARGARPRGRDDRRDQDGRPGRLPQLHGRGHRQARLRQDQRATSSTDAATRRSSPAARSTAARATSSARRSSRPTDPGYKLLCEEIFGPVLTAHVYDDAKWDETLKLVDSTSPYALTGAVFAQDRARDRPGDVGAAARRRQLLRQRQADRRGGRPAAVRRRARVGHQRQGRVEAEPDALGQRADGEGELQPADGLPLPVHERGVNEIAGRRGRSCPPACGALHSVRASLDVALLRTLRNTGPFNRDSSRCIERRRLTRRTAPPLRSAVEGHNFSSPTRLTRAARS